MLQVITLAELLTAHRLEVACAALLVLTGTLWLIRRRLGTGAERSAFSEGPSGEEDVGTTVVHGDVEPVFKNMPNFRQAGGKGLMNRRGQKIKDRLLFRSSRTDFLTGEEKATFMNLGIKTIIDLRRKAEYERAEGDKILDDAYPPYLLRKGKVTSLRPSFRWGGRKKTGKAAGAEASGRRRLIVNLMTMDLIWSIFNRINFFVRYLSLVLVVTDWLTGAHLFVKFFTWALLNKQTMADQYVETLEHCKGAVADILRVMSDPGNVPVLIHCAHGKDRTGMVVALVLACLEIEDDVIFQDYAQSEVCWGVGWYVMLCVQEGNGEVWRV